MTKLNQILAIEKGVKSQSYSDISAADKLVKKPDLFSGIARTYRPKDDEGDRLPPQSTKIQVTVAEVLQQVADSLTRLFDVTATKDWANQVARADVVIEGEVLLEAVPVTYLLFLEKQMNDIKTFIGDLPTLDPSEDWSFDENSDSYATPAVETAKTAKVPHFHVAYEATEHHPAQVVQSQEDIVVGYWKTLRFSGAVPVGQINGMLERVTALIAAIKYAREAANGVDVKDQNIGLPVFSYIFGV